MALEDSLIAYYAHHQPEVALLRDPQALFLLERIRSWGPIKLSVLAERLGMTSTTLISTYSLLLNAGMVEEKDTTANDSSVQATNKGTEFISHFAIWSELSLTERPVLEVPDQLERITVLIADADDAWRSTFMAELQQLFEQPLVIEEAQDGWSALGKVLRSRPEIIILDTHLAIFPASDITYFLQRRLANMLIIILHTGPEFLDQQGYNVPKGRSRVAVLQKDQYPAFTAIGVSREIMKFFLHRKRTLPKTYNRLGYGSGSQRIPGSPRYSLATTPSSLSSRQLDVLRLLAQGLSTKEVASKLAIAERTVQKHIAAIYRKLDLNARDEVVTMAQEAGWLDAPDIESDESERSENIVGQDSTDVSGDRQEYSDRSGEG
jgi:DNA-binding NarL/FixJ family response regulator/predicted transcriptional regulator